MNLKNWALQKEKSGNKEMKQSKKTNVLYSLTEEEYKVYKKNQTKHKIINSSDYQTSQWCYF
jgi:hypothetical protein